jgi:hypothetical protein
MAKHIKINTITGPSDGNALEDFYFEESGDGYNFFQPTHPTPTQLNTDLITPTNPAFHFTLAGFPNPFYITVTSFPAVQAMSGNWSDQPQGKDVPGSGTFQAQAGGTGPIAKEDVSAASAK